jgi:hypothetical protein
METSFIADADLRAAYQAALTIDATETRRETLCSIARAAVLYDLRREARTIIHRMPHGLDAFWPGLRLYLLDRRPEDATLLRHCLRTAEQGHEAPLTQITDHLKLLASTEAFIAGDAERCVDLLEGIEDEAVLASGLRLLHDLTRDRVFLDWLNDLRVPQPELRTRRMPPSKGTIMQNFGAVLDREDAIIRQNNRRRRFQRLLAERRDNFLVRYDLKLVLEVGAFDLAEQASQLYGWSLDDEDLRAPAICGLAFLGQIKEARPLAKALPHPMDRAKAYLAIFLARHRQK